MGSLGGALGQVGQNIAAAPTNLYQRSGLGDIGAGLQSLFGDGGDEAGYLESLGQTVPEGVELVGPSPTFTGPGFLGGLMQGLGGSPGEYASPSPGTQTGSGVGELLALLNKIRQQSGQMVPMAPTPGGQGPSVRLLPGYTQAGAPTGGLVHNLIGAATYGILGGAIPSSGQV